MFYLDTSVLVSAFVQERASELVLAWIAARFSDRLAISEWTITEFSSALGVKLRTRAIGAADRSRALLEFDRMTRSNLAVCEVQGSHFRRAAAFVNDPRLALRGGDALHLAIASDNRLTIATLDRRLADAGAPLGIPTQLLV